MNKTTAYPTRKNDVDSSKEVAYLSSSLTNNDNLMAIPVQDWHTTDHFSSRDIMQHCIMHLIRQREEVASGKYLAVLPDVARTLEKHLYSSASSFELYNDPKTLISRLTNLVKQLIHKESIAAKVKIVASLAQEAERAAHKNASSSVGKALRAHYSAEERSGVNVVEEIKVAPCDPVIESSDVESKNMMYVKDPNSNIKPRIDNDNTATAPNLLEMAQLLSSLSSAPSASSQPTQTVEQPITERLTYKSADTLSDSPSTNTSAVGHSLLEQEASVKIPIPKALNSNTVSSQGCSRVFIVKVLKAISDHVRGQHLPSIFTFNRDIISKWLHDAKMACSPALNPDIEKEEKYYGGPVFIFEDPTTHWTEPAQLFTWWKNNVERKNKYRVLLIDSCYDGTDMRRLARAAWCEAIISLSEVIRASSGNSHHGGNYHLSPKPNGGIKDNRPNVVDNTDGVTISNQHVNLYDQASTSASSVASPIPHERTDGFKINSSGNLMIKVEPSGNRMDVDVPLMINTELDDRRNDFEKNAVEEQPYKRMKLSNGLCCNSSEPLRIDTSLSSSVKETIDSALGRSTFSPNASKSMTPKVSSEKLNLNMPANYDRFPHKLYDMLAMEEKISKGLIEEPVPMGVREGLDDFDGGNGRACSSATENNMNPESVAGNCVNDMPLLLVKGSPKRDPIVQWLPEHKGFQVLDMAKFVSVVLPRYFKRKSLVMICNNVIFRILLDECYVYMHLFIDRNFTSFQRQLNLYGFKRMRMTSAKYTQSNGTMWDGNAGSNGNDNMMANTSPHALDTGKGSYIYTHPLFSYEERSQCDAIRRASTAAPAPVVEKTNNSVYVDVLAQALLEMRK